MARGSLGSLVVSLAADTARFQGDLGRAATIAERRMRNIRESATRALGALTVAATAAGVALTAAVRSQLKAGDEFAKTARQVGMAVESLTAMTYQAELGGVSADKLRTSLIRLSANAMEAANGSGQAAESFKMLGISATDAEGRLRSSDALMGDVAERFATMEDGAEKTALAVRIFGRAGAELIPMLSEGREGMEAARKEAERLGIVWSTDAAQAAERFNNNMTRLKNAGRGLAVQLTERVLPTIEALSDRFVESMATTDGMTRAVDQLEAGFKSLTTVAVTAYTALQYAGTAIGGFFAWLKESEFGTKNVDLGVWRDLNNIASEFGMTLETLWGPAVERAATQVVPPLERIREALTFGDETNIADVLDEASEAAERAARIFEQTRNDMERYVEALNEAASLRAQGLLDDDTYWRYIDQIEEGFHRIEEVAEETLTNQIPAFADQAARNIQTTLAQFLFDPFNEGLSGMLRGFADTLRRMAAEAAASQILKGMFGGTEGIGGWIGGVFGGGRASGGPVSRGTAYLVGERGPELFMPGQNGTIIPNGGGGSVTFNIDARGADAQLTRALPAILESFGQRIKADIAMSRSRGRAL